MNFLSLLSFIPSAQYKLLAGVIAVASIAWYSHHAGYTSAMTEVQAASARDLIEANKEQDAALQKQKGVMRAAAAESEERAKSEFLKALDAQREQAKRELREAKLHEKVKIEVRTKTVYRDVACAIPSSGVGLWNAAAQGRDGEHAHSGSSADSEAIAAGRSNGFDPEVPPPTH